MRWCVVCTLKAVSVQFRKFFYENRKSFLEIFSTCTMLQLILKSRLSVYHAMQFGDVIFVIHSVGLGRSTEWPRKLVCCAVRLGQNQQQNAVYNSEAKKDSPRFIAHGSSKTDSSCCTVNYQICRGLTVCRQPFRWPSFRRYPFGRRTYFFHIHFVILSFLRHPFAGHANFSKTWVDLRQICGFLDWFLLAMAQTKAKMWHKCKK